MEDCFSYPLFSSENVCTKGSNDWYRLNLSDFRNCAFLNLALNLVLFGTWYDLNILYKNNNEIAIYITH